MSIEDEISGAVTRKMLYPLLPLAKGIQSIRVLLLGEKLWAVLNSPEGDEDWERRVGELQADLEVFISEPFIYPEYLFLLYPSSDGVWEIRSTGSDPSIRVLGLFALRDVLVAGEIALREDLGSWQSREWKQVKRNAKAVWRQLFSTYQPIIASNVDNVITGATGGKYSKHTC